MSTANTLELGMLALINDERAAAGLEPLTMITLLNDAAETHSSWMLEENQFSHQGEDGSSTSERIEDAGYPFEGNSLAAENIGWQSARGEEGFADDVAQVHANLMNSSGHRANILNPDADNIGIGIELGTFSGGNGDFEAVMVTQVFGATDADVSAWVDPETGTNDLGVFEDLIAEEDGNGTDTPIAPEAENEPNNSADKPVIFVDDDTPVIVVDDDMPVTTADVPDDITEEIAENDWPLPLSEPEQPTEDTAEVIMIDNPPACALGSLTVDLSNVFKFNRDGDQVTLETTEDKLFAALQDAFDDWAFMMEDPAAGEEMNISDLMIDGAADGANDPLACDLFEEEDENDLAMLCI